MGYGVGCGCCWRHTQLMVRIQSSVRFDGCTMLISKSHRIVVPLLLLEDRACNSRICYWSWITVFCLFELMLLMDVSLSTSYLLCCLCCYTCNQCACCLFGEGKFSCTEGGLCVLDLKVPYQELLSVPGTLIHCILIWQTRSFTRVHWGMSQWLLREAEESTEMCH